MYKQDSMRIAANEMVVWNKDFFKASDVKITSSNKYMGYDVEIDNHCLYFKSDNPDDSLYVKFRFFYECDENEHLHYYCRTDNYIRAIDDVEYIYRQAPSLHKAQWYLIQGSKEKELAQIENFISKGKFYKRTWTEYNKTLREKRNGCGDWITFVANELPDVVEEEISENEFTSALGGDHWKWEWAQGMDLGF